MVSRAEIDEIIRTTYDPELDVDLKTLGLIYGVDFDEATQKLKVTMTFTTPLCPYGGQMVDELLAKFRALGLSDVEIDVASEPPWEPPAGIREMLGV